MNVDLSLAGEFETSSASVRSDQRIADAQLNPLASTRAVELGHIQLAFVQVLVASSHAATNVSGIPVGGRDKFVDVFIATVATHVESQRLAHYRNAANCSFVCKAAHRRALGRAC